MQLWVSIKRWFGDLYLVVFAFVFIAIGGTLSLLPMLRGTIWQTIGGALFASGFAILVAAITARQSSFEQYKKEANLQRKRDVYGPLHSELKELRKRFDEVQAGRAPYPQYFAIPGDSFRPTLIWTAYQPPTFVWWPTYKENYHVDDFTPAAQSRLNEVQSCVEAYNTTLQAARETVQIILMRHIVMRIEKEAQRSSYQEWLQRGQTGPYSVEIRWFEFIKMQTEAVSSDMPFGKGLAQTWVYTIEWLLADRADQAAQKIYDTDARQWGAPNAVEFSWFQDIFDVTLADLKCETSYKQVMLAQEELFKQLQDAEQMLEEGLRYIRDRYEGGNPPV